MMSRKIVNQGPYEPKKCWVGETQKIIYDTREEAEVAAKVAEYEHGATGLSAYKCEYGDHWHLTKNLVKKDLKKRRGLICES